jgi:ankyrin repeat protein
MPRWPKRKERPGMDRYGRTPLWHHCFNGDLEAASEVIAAGADPSFDDDVNYSPLHVAVQERRVAVIRLRLASGADPNKTDNHGNSPPWNAVLSAPRDLRVACSWRRGPTRTIENANDACHATCQAPQFRH